MHVGVQEILKLMDRKVYEMYFAYLVLRLDTWWQIVCLLDLFIFVCSFDYLLLCFLIIILLVLESVG